MTNTPTVFQIQNDRITLQFCTNTLRYQISVPGKIWQSTTDIIPHIRLKDDRTIPFTAATDQNHHYYHSGVGTGILSSYDGFVLDDQTLHFSFETLVWIEYATGHIRFELIPG